MQTTMSPKQGSFPGTFINPRP